MTGFLTIVTGFSFSKEARIARRRISLSKSGRARTSRFGRKALESSGEAIRLGIGGVMVVDMRLAPHRQDEA
jgi:hypothetical protein